MKTPNATSTFFLLCCFFISSAFSPQPANGQTSSIQNAQETGIESKTEGVRLPIRPAEAWEVAEETHVALHILNFSSLPESVRCVRGGAAAFEILILRQDITEAVLDSSFEIDSFIAEIDVELMEIGMARASLQSRHERAI